MALGELTKQLATQALGDSMKNLLEPEKAEKGAPHPPADTLCAAVLAQIQAMQKALKEDQELLVSATAAGERIRVLEIFVPSQKLFVLTGVDAEKNLTRVIAPVDSTQLVCKVVKASANPVRIAIKVAR